MPTSKELFEVFSEQLAHLAAIAENDRIGTAIAGKPSDALAFAESILVCQTDDTARAQMLRDQKGAVSFFQISKFVLETFSEREIPTGGQSLKDTGPFFVAGSCVQDYLIFLKESSPEEWQ